MAPLQLSLEMEDASAASVAMRKLAVSLSDSTELRYGVVIVCVKLRELATATVLLPGF